MRTEKSALLSVLLPTLSAFFAAEAKAQQASATTTYTLMPTPKTMVWGYYDAKAAPVLRVKSGYAALISSMRPQRRRSSGSSTSSTWSRRFVTLLSLAKRGFVERL